MKSLHVRVAGAVIALSVVALAGLGGCEGQTRQGTLYSIQPDRELEAYLPGDLATVHAAALAVIETDFGYAVEESAVDTTEGVVKARTALDHLIRVELYKYGERVTRIEVYAGPKGAESIANDILSAIETRLTAP
jgi:hypothetical protein